MPRVSTRAAMIAASLNFCGRAMREALVVPFPYTGGSPHGKPASVARRPPGVPRDASGAPQGTSGRPPASAAATAVVAPPSVPPGPEPADAVQPGGDGLPRPPRQLAAPGRRLPRHQRFPGAVKDQLHHVPHLALVERV